MPTSQPSQRLLQRTLHALLLLGRANQPAHVGALSRLTGASATRLAEALIALERAGLVDASRARLTLPGLAAASSIAARDLAPLEPSCPAAGWQSGQGRAGAPDPDDGTREACQSGLPRLLARQVRRKKEKERLVL